MGARTNYDPGVFCWADLAAADVEAARRFYGPLFGWDFEDADGYLLALRDGAVAAGLTAKADDGPARWQSYVAVESADAAAERASQAGAQVLAGPLDVRRAGRTALLQDPTGAVVLVWEGRDRAGAEVVNAPGALCWNDLMTRDVAAAVGFYGEAFGWRLEAVEGAPGDRHSIRAGQTLNGGIAALPDGLGPDVPSYWLACFAVEAVPASVSAAEASGGRPVMDMLELPTGRFAVLTDPEGAVFGLIDGDMDP